MTEKAHCLVSHYSYIRVAFLRSNKPLLKNYELFSQEIKPMVGSEPTTFRLQGECSSQAELHWHEVK